MTVREKLFKLVQTCSNLFKLVQTCPNLFKLVILSQISGRLQPGDQLLKVDGTSLVGITQDKAAEIMMHTGENKEFGRSGFGL